MIKEVKVPQKGKKFKNNALYCIGTGRLGLALQNEYIDHLKTVQNSIHFKYIRGHGLFCDDIGIYREYEKDGKVYPFYNFTYLDRIFDTFIENGIKPFLELGFMPEKLKTGEETVFYWKANTTPPKSYEKFVDLIKATLNHLIDRYGRDEVVLWPIEVWNEPNIAFWSGTMEEYFKIYNYSAKAVKEVDSRIQVGGPAICGVETEKWLRGFIEYCIESEAPLDFITRHIYSANTPRNSGHYVYHTINDVSNMIEELKETREIMDSYYLTANLKLHITEFNTSYNPLCPVHDTTFNAAYIARFLSVAGEYADSYSYWTFSDVFEEADVPKSVFHGGFGLVANYNIKKPTFYAFEFFSKAGKKLLYRDDNVIVTRDGNKYVIIGWNYHDMRDNKISPNKSYSFTLPSIGKQSIVVKKDVGGNHANPMQTWSNLGKPRYLNKEQLEILEESSKPMQTDEKIFEYNNEYKVELSIPCNHLCMLEITDVNDMTDTYLGFEKQEFYGME